MGDEDYLVDVISSSRYPVDKKRIRKRVKSFLVKEFPDRKVEIGVVFVGARKIKQLNKDFRKKDYIANVLSFPMQEIDDGEGFMYPDDGVLYLGSTVICYPKARDEAGSYQMRVDDYIDELVEHSLDHLVGRHHD